MHPLSVAGPATCRADDPPEACQGKGIAPTGGSDRRDPAHFHLGRTATLYHVRGINSKTRVR